MNFKKLSERAEFKGGHLREDCSCVDRGISAVEGSEWVRVPAVSLEDLVKPTAS